MMKNNGKLKSVWRKPLRDVSNGGVKSSILGKKKEELPVSDENQVDEVPLDRLLLVHSDISSLLRQIDELVIQAVKVKTSDSDRSKEIKSFTNVLSKINSSLKPWVLRLQKALDVSLVESETPLTKTSIGAPTIIDRGDEDEVDTPEPNKFESLVSPSPLVSWRATDCTLERGKQLFLLTPLPRARTLISEVHPSSKPTTYEGIISCTTSRVPSLCGKNVESTSDFGFQSPPKIPIRDSSTVLMTPCLKLPPKSCVLLEPDREFSNRKMKKPCKSTPFPVGNKKLCDSTDSETSSGEVSEKLGLKYPELIGIKSSWMSRNGTKAMEASPMWMMSPPKCCTLLEPPDEKKPVEDNAPLGCHLKELASAFNEQICLVPPTKKSIQVNDLYQENMQFCTQANLGCIVESTPMWKGCESTIHRGKRPGENTLKKELWTKFEAATTNESRLNFSVSQDACPKGFLDMLEEASCD